MEAFLRSRQQLPAEPSPEDHVKAPPDLIDDDVTKSKLDETPATTPQTDTPAKKSAEPVLEAHGQPLPVSDVRHVREMNRRKLDQQKKNQGGS